MKLTILFLFLIGLSACSAQATDANTAMVNELKVIPPASGAYHGAFADFGATEDFVTEAAISNFISLAGKRISWAYFSNHWLNGEIRFPRANVEACRRQGVIPYIRMLPWSRLVQHQPDPIFSMQAIINGQFDAPIREWARNARDTQYPIMIEFGPEVNGEWFPWNGKWNGGGTKEGYGDPNHPDGPERFKDAFKRVIEIFRQERARNVTWVLHVDSQWNPQASWNQLKYYYPGDNYIDWIGVSVFGAQLPSFPWTIFSDILGDFWWQIEAASRNQPVLISEYGVIEDSRRSGRKAEWIREALLSISSQSRFSRVKGVTYWHSPGWAFNNSKDFRINTSPESLQAYRSEIANSNWIDRAQIRSQRLRDYKDVIHPNQ